MGVSGTKKIKDSSSRKQKSKLEKGQRMLKATQVKEQPEEIPCMGQTAVLKGKKKVKEKPLQENTISRSSLRHEVAEEKYLSSSWQDGIQVKEEAASLLEETDSILHQGSSEGLKDSSRSKSKSQREGPAVGQQLSETEDKVGLLEPSRGDNGVAALLSGEPGASGLAVEVTTLRESVEKVLDPHVPVQKGDARGMKRKKETEKKQEPKKQKENLFRKRGIKKDKLEESLGNVMEDIGEEDGADGDRNCGVRQGKAKQRSSSTWRRADEREKQKRRGEKRKKVKERKVKMRKD
ncbi:eukaryotic translation initiation factor 5B-like [Phasianus colchicus]|uniref:eukaryotic translation initiation factor 5B-like n=1 Tax=Phasianus colchicus TaxID=9054 RepID=UPI00129E611D|nr:eukaryotic translation initiation factor 5B-like [Phasianus colchicus]